MYEWFKIKATGNDNGAGIMILNKEHPHIIHYRSKEAVLSPELPQERHGIISNVVFPTGIDRRDDLGLPDILPPEFVAVSQEAMV